MKESEILLGVNIGYLCDVRKLITRAELAEALGMSPQNIGQLIRGENKGMKPLNLVKAAKRVGLTVEQLITQDVREALPMTGGLKLAKQKGPREEDFLWMRAQAYTVRRLI